jgi:hypothetical protein
VAGYDGDNGRIGGKVCVAVNTPGHLLAIPMTPANEKGNNRVAKMARQL